MLSKRFFRRSTPFCLALTLSACASIGIDPSKDDALGEVKEPATEKKDQLVDKQKAQTEKLQDHKKQVKQKTSDLKKEQEKAQTEQLQDYKKQVEQKTSDLKKDKAAAVDQVSRTRKTTDVIDPALRRMQTQGSKAPRVTRPMKM